MTANRADPPPRPFMRARRPEEQALRLEAIVRATAELIEEAPLESLSLSSIARRAGVSKASVYRYFESREAILLHLFQRDIHDCAAALESALQPLAGTGDVAALAGAVGGAFIARPRLCRFLGIVNSVLEQNVSEELIVALKTDLAAVGLRVARVIQAALPGLPVAACAWGFTSVTLLAASLWPAAHPSPQAGRVLARTEFQSLQFSLELDLTRAVRVLFAGLLWEQQTASPVEENF